MHITLLTVLAPCGVAQAAESLHADAQLTGRSFGSMRQSTTLGDLACGDPVIQHVGKLTSGSTFWNKVRPAPGVYDFSQANAVAAFVQAHGMLRGHTLVWYNANPPWFEWLSLSREEALAMLRDHIHTVIRHYQTNYPGLVKEWDVVNEPVSDDVGLRSNVWTQWIGTDYIEHAFRYAAEVADPDVKLILNEYFISNAPTRPGSGCGGHLKCRQLRSLVARLVRKGVRIDAIGLQGHLWLTPVELPDLGPLTSWIGKLGLTWQVSELDAGIPPTNDARLRFRQAAAFRRVTQSCLRDRWCSGTRPGTSAIATRGWASRRSSSAPSSGCRSTSTSARCRRTSRCAARCAQRPAQCPPWGNGGSYGRHHQRASSVVPYRGKRRLVAHAALRPAIVPQGSVPSGHSAESTPASALSVSQ